MIHILFDILATVFLLILISVSLVILIGVWILAIQMFKDFKAKNREE